MSEGIIIKHGSSGSGGTLTIDTLADVTVTATKDDKIKTTTANSQGIAVLKGLTNGTWQVSIDDATHEPTTPVAVEIVLDYNVTITFFSATINITYPVGSVCTATDGNMVLRAPDTSGSWSVVVPATGEWVISCTDGVTTATETVIITSNGQAMSITLTYLLVLYSPGDEHTAVTGGWIVYQNAKISKTSTHLQITPTQQWDGNQAIVGCKNMIDLTNITTLYAEGLNNCGGDEYLGFTVSDSNLEIKRSTWWSPNTTTTKRLDVSSLSGSYYVGFMVAWGSTYKGDGRIYNVWGE